MPGMALDYKKLLAATLPEVIQVEEEYERHKTLLDALMAKGEALTDPQAKLLSLLGLLIQDYERRRFRLGETATPRSVLLALMEDRGLKHKDVWKLFGSRGVASEVMNGKRGISKQVAKRLATFFQVPADVFL